MYKINYSNFRRMYKKNIYGIILLLILLIGEVYFKFENIKGNIILIVMTFGLFLWELIGMIRIKNKINTVKGLANNGTLISNLSYARIKETHGFDANNPHEHIEVTYNTVDGRKLILRSEPKYDFYCDRPDVVDLLIDLNDTSKYFIDFNIREI